MDVDAVPAVMVEVKAALTSTDDKVVFGAAMFKPMTVALAKREALAAVKTAILAVSTVPSVLTAAAKLMA